ncbi:MAG: UDP-N-acetylmuramoyl-tripeptide--D-alanyl-D-alanine ligase [Candidatus Nanopelagicales bacterium]
MKFSLTEIASIVEGTLSGSDADITSIATDSRNLKPGALFIALHGSNFDGHDFVEDAISKGAVAVLVSRPVPGTHIHVSNTLIALGQIAATYRKSLPATVIAITGSSGKTSTKDLMACALSPFGLVVKSERSLNNEIGVPLTILQADSSTDFLILEMGMRGLGQIDYLTKIASPNVSVLLNAGSAHLSELGSRENILKAKSEIFHNMVEPKIKITSADDARLVELGSNLETPMVFFGQSTSANVCIEDLSISENGFPSSNIKIHGETTNLTIPRVGEHQMLNAAAVIAVIGALKLDLPRALQSLSGCKDSEKWRMQIIELQNDITVINDAYNANPESMRAGLRALKDYAKKRRTWAVLGEMLELGETSLEEHDALGRLCVRLDVSKTLAVGQSARSIQLGASLEGSWNQESIFAETVEQAIDVLIHEVQPGDVVFIKASRAVGLERVAMALENHFGGKNMSP